MYLTSIRYVDKTIMPLTIVKLYPFIYVMKVGLLLLH